ncbi:hypothetical protein OEZ86_013160 [Tetradesmus obliquus]|nr:hypothetical protein OEZ86_013160 [Tetradesmus obliquus]
MNSRVAHHLLQKIFPQQFSDPAADPASQQQQQAGAAPAGRRFKGLLRQVAPSAACSELVASEEFHLPLVECAVQLVAFITGEEHQQQYHWATQQLQRQGYAASLWQAASTFHECFSAGSAFPLPPLLQQYLQRLQELLLDGPALASGSQLYSIMTQGGGCHFAEGDTGLVDNLLRAYSAQAVQRAQLVGWRILQQQQQQPQPTAQQQQHLPLPDSFPEQCAWLMDRVLLEHLDVCFGQAMSVVVACVVYVAAKLLQASVTFKLVTEVIGSCVENTPAGTFQRTELQPAQSGAAAEYGDVRMFYNARFLPAIEGSVRQYLQDYQQHISSTAAHSMHTTDVPAASTATAAPQQDEATGETPAVQATPAATVAGVTPGRRPFGALNANTRPAGNTMHAVKIASKVAPYKGTVFEELPAEAAMDECSKAQGEAQATAPAAVPNMNELLAGTQAEQAAAAKQARASRRATRSVAGAAAGLAANAALPSHAGRDRLLGLFSTAAAVSSPAAAGRTPTRLMR